MIRVRDMNGTDWPAVERIYADGIDDGEATFEVEPPSWQSFDAGRLPEPRFVAIYERDEILGWVAASPVSARHAYRGVVEHSVYVGRDARGRGVGRLLLESFIVAADRAGIWTIQASIFPENTASLHLHQACGFRVVGRRERIAQATVGPHAGRWRDTLLIERRRA